MSQLALRCVALAKGYRTAVGDVHALRGLDLELPVGTFLAVTGPSGCGKTTLLNLVGALDRPSSGTLEVFGQELSGLGPRERALYRRGTVGFVFQQFHLVPTLTALENVALPLHYAGVPRPERRSQALALLERVGLGARTTHFPTLLSGGEQQRVAVARALAGGAKLLLADEPTGNRDSETADAVVRLLREAVADGVTVVLVTHDPEVARLADRQLRLRDGRIETDSGAPDRRSAGESE